MSPHDEAELRHSFSTAVAELSDDQRLIVLELAAAGPIIFQVRLDDLGIPHVLESPKAAWNSLDLASSLPAPDSGLVLVSTTAETSPMQTALSWVHATYPGTPTWVMPGADVRGLLAEAIADSPIRQSYGLLVAHADPSDSRIRLASERLFVKGARRGAIAELAVRNECADEDGTVFAVVAGEGGNPWLLSVDSVPLQPGRYRVRAELCRPGKVQFVEPANTTRDPRGLTEIIATVPSTLDSMNTVHLICAVEVAGPAARVAARVYCVEKIIKTIHQQRPELSRLQVGLLGYGGHRFDRREKDARVIVEKWQATPHDALKSLGRLGAADLGYPYAAQIEDMLAEVVRRLGTEPQSHRTVLLVFGDRPPHPAAIGGQVPPCPKRRNWQKLLGILEQQPGFTIAAIRDEPSAPGTEAWTRLGSAAPLSLETVDVSALASQVGLVAPSLRHMAIPMIDSGGTASPDLPESIKTPLS